MKLYLLLLIAACVLAKEGPLPIQRRIVCYYTNWSGYRPTEFKFSAQNVDPYLCSHILYAFVGIDQETNTIISLDESQDIEKGGIKDITDLKTQNGNLKVLVSIGGWNFGTAKFSNLVADETKRVEFVKNTITYLRKNNFDGVDICWQYPTFREGGSPADKENYVKLLKELREAFDVEAKDTLKPRLQLSVVVSGLSDYIEKAFDVPAVNKYVDFVNLIGYDYHLSSGPSVNHHSALYAAPEDVSDPVNSQLNADASVKSLLAKGFNREKINLGIPTYGRLYELEDASETDPGSPAIGSGKGNTTREVGYMPYFELCAEIKNNEWKVVHKNESIVGPYAVKNTLWIGYDDVESTRNKGEYARKQGLGGLMFWTIDDDDFLGRCDGDPYPLIKGGRAGLMPQTDTKDSNSY